MAHAHAPTAADVAAIGQLIEAEYGLSVVEVEPAVLGLNCTFKVRTDTECVFRRT